MASRRLFALFYRLGYTPWDGQPLRPRLRQLIEGSAAAEPLPPASALDLGCGTGDNAIYLAHHGWHVTGVDFVDRPLKKARSKAAAAGVTVNFIEADVTQLTRASLNTDFALIVDSGCLHNFPAKDRPTYVSEVTSVAAPHGYLFIVGYPPGARRGVLGITDDELINSLALSWTLVSTNDPDTPAAGELPLREYVFRRLPR